jgi:hypothetical protein
MILSKLPCYLRGDLTRKTILAVLLPLIFLSYFGVLGLAVLLYPDSYDWRYLSISKLLYPLTNPQFHSVAAFSVAVTGVLMLPFAGYIRRRLHGVFPRMAAVGATLFFAGCLCLTLAGLIASHPAHGTARFPKLHEILARVSVVSIGLGMAMFDTCATKGYFRAAPGNALHRRGLLISWNLLTLPMILVAVSWLVIRAFVKRTAPAYHTIATSAAWHVGFWEWPGSVVVFAFLVCSVLFLPEPDSR